MPRRLFLPFIVLFEMVILTSCEVISDDTSDDIEKYYGTWNVNDQASKLNYVVTISANPSNSAEILLNNFADLNSSAVGLVVGSSVVIDNQSLGSDYSVSGTGVYINSGKLEFDFVLDDGIDSESRTAVFTK